MAYSGGLLLADVFLSKWLIDQTTFHCRIFDDSLMMTDKTVSILMEYMVIKLRRTQGPVSTASPRFNPALPLQISHNQRTATQMRSTAVASVITIRIDGYILKRQ